MQGIITSTLKDTVRAYPGCWMSFRLTSNETNDNLSVIDIHMMPGAEPPRHIHQWEDETVIIHDGTATFFVGDEIINGKKGDIIFMPRNVAHHFILTSPTVHCTLVTTPGGIENFFDEITFPFEGQTIPASGKPTPDQVKAFNESAERFGMKFV